MTKYKLFEYHLSMLLVNSVNYSSKHFRKLFDHIETNKYILINKYRQVGMSTMLLAYALANPDKSVTYFAPNITSCDHLRRRLEYLPFLPGEKIRNRTQIKNIRFVSSIQTDPMIGRQSDIVIFDEVAHFQKQYHHYYSAIPGITTGGKLIISTTPINKEVDLFYNLFINALDEKNNFKIECFGKIN